MATCKEMSHLLRLTIIGLNSFTRKPSPHSSSCLKEIPKKNSVFISIKRKHSQLKYDAEIARADQDCQQLQKQLNEKYFR